MSHRQGQRISQGEHNRIIDLLRNTELSMNDIGRRMGISGSAVDEINRERGIRIYTEGKRGQWTLADGTLVRTF